MAVDINEITKLVKEVKRLTKIYGIDLENVSLDTCRYLLDSSKILNEKLEKFLKDGITEDEINKIDDFWVAIILDLFMSKRGIVPCKSIQKEDDKDLKYDAYSICYRYMSQFSVPTEDEEKKLFERLNNGDESALDEIVNRNMRLVARVAKSKAKNKEQEMDFIQDGSIGLIKAARKFDINKGYRFSTYAMWYLKESIDRSFDYDKPVIVPDYMIQRTKKVLSLFYSENGCFPNPKELAELLKIPYQDLLNYMLSTAIPANLDEPIDCENNESLLNFVQDTESKGTDVLALEGVCKETLKHFMEVYLTEKEYYALEHIWGIDGADVMSRTAIAHKLNVTPERVRQLDQNARLKLSHCKKLKSFVD